MDAGMSQTTSCWADSCIFDASAIASCTLSITNPDAILVGWLKVFKKARDSVKYAVRNNQVIV